MANAGIWALAMIALVFILEKGTSPRGLFVILAGGVAVAIQLIIQVNRMKKEPG
jgi:uncharacterized membrane protein YpjA